MSNLMDKPSTSFSAAGAVCGTASAPRVAPRACVDAHAWAPPTTSGIGETLKAFGLALLVVVPAFAIGVVGLRRERAAELAAYGAQVFRQASLERVLAAPAGDMLLVDDAAKGRDTFLSACASCHGAEGRGMPKLGKDLVHSWFVASLDDAALTGFVAQGRGTDSADNTTRVAMPARGGREDLTDEDLRRVVVYLRGLQDGRRMPALPAPVVTIAPITEAEKAAALAAAGGDAELAEFIASGTKLFSQSCAACHGKDAKGIEKNGKNLIASEFARKLSDDDLLAFIKRGRDPGDPLNTTGVGMPAKGGNPALSDDDLLDIISYLRSLQSASASK
jgi:disulfide bond formation protein DsbB